MSTESIAMLALGISFLSFAWGIFVFIWRGRPRKTIQLKSITIETKYGGEGRDITSNHIGLEVVNHEFQPIAIDTYGFMDKTGKEIYWDNPKSNEKTIDGRDNHTYSIDVVAARKGFLVKEDWNSITHVYVEDVIGRKDIHKIPASIIASMNREIRPDINP